MTASLSPIDPDERRIGIRDTSAQDEQLQTARRPPWLKWGGIALGFLLLLAAAGSVLTKWLSADASVSADRVRIAVVERGDIVRDVSVSGRIVAAISPTLYSPATGTVTLEVQSGDTVEEGQVLAVVDSPEVRAQYLQEVSTLDRLNAELDRERINARKEAVARQQDIDLAQVTLTAAEREMRRAEESIQTNAISRVDYERARDDLATARVEHEHAVQDAALDSESLEFEARTRELAVERQQLVVDELQRQVDGLAIRSPVSGIVGNLAIQQKAVVNQNDPLITVVDLTAFEVEVRIPEAYADELGMGIPGEVQYNGREYSGALASLSAEVVNNEVVGRIRFTDNAPPGLRQNQRVTVRMVIDHLEDVLKLQRGAFTDAGGGRTAFVLGADGIAHRRTISLGARSISEVEVLDGLQPGERVIISSLAEYQDYDSIQIVD